MPDLCLDMVCQRSRDKSKGDTSRKQAPSYQSRQDEPESVLPVTKAALETLNHSDSIKAPAASTVSVSDDGDASVNSSTESMPPPTTLPSLLKGAISSDKDLVKTSLRKRDEVERLKIAKAMLYESYLKAIRGE